MASKTGRGRGLSIIPGGRGDQSSATLYDEAEFLVGGKGTGAGEVSKQSFKLHEGYIAEAERWMRSGLFPYRSMTDLYRHAVVRHLYWLQSLEPEEIEGSVLYQVSQIDEVVAAEEYQLRFATQSIEPAAKMVRGLIKIPGGKAHIGTVLRRLKRKIGLMQDGFWKAYYEELFQSEFGVYLNDGLVLLNIDGEGEDGGEGEGEEEEEEGG